MKKKDIFALKGKFLYVRTMKGKWFLNATAKGGHLMVRLKLYFQKHMTKHV